MSQHDTSDETALIQTSLLQLEQLLKKAQENYNDSVSEMQKQLNKIHSHCNRVNRARRRHKFLSRLKNFFSPRLGRLACHPAKPLVIPPRYKKNSKPGHLSISIVTPSFNQGEFIERTIKSVIDQNYPYLEYVVQDGKSTDKTVSILKDYSKALTYWESVKDYGQTNAINRGFQHTTGEIMAYLNSDDILLPGSLNYVANYFADHPEVDVVYSHRVLIDADDHEIGRWILPAHDKKILLWADYIPQETLFWRRTVWDKIGGCLDENFHFAMDWDLLMRFHQANAKLVRLPRFLGAFRVHQEQKTSSAISNIGAQEMRALRFRAHQRHVTPTEIKKHTASYLCKHLVFQKLYRLKLLKH